MAFQWNETAATRQLKWATNKLLMCINVSFEMKSVARSGFFFFFFLFVLFVLFL